MKKKRLAIEATVVGLQFQLSKQVRSLMAKKMVPFSITIEREPDNEHDSNAIRVLVNRKGALNDQQLGYVNREVAAELAPRMDSGQLVSVGGIVTWMSEQEADAMLDFDRVKSKAETVS